MYVGLFTVITSHVTWNKSILRYDFWSDSWLSNVDLTGIISSASLVHTGLIHRIQHPFSEQHLRIVVNIFSFFITFFHYIVIRNLNLKEICGSDAGVCAFIAGRGGR
jgi:hypothetical protein